jgi:hypothetical protein
VYPALLPYLKVSPDYKIVALLNISVDLAAVIERYELPASTKAHSKLEGQFLPHSPNPLSFNFRFQFHDLSIDV